MTINDKIIKYLFKIKKSDKKNPEHLKKFLYYYQKGGSNILEKKFTNTIQENFIGLKNFLDKIFEEKNLKNPFGDKKFFVILMGTPGSGKSLARKLIVKKLIDKFGKPATSSDASSASPDDASTASADTLTFKKVLNSFLDISIDDLVYNLKLNENQGSKTIKEKFDSLRIGKNIKDLSEDEIKNIAEETSKIYRDFRKEVDPLSYMFIFLSAYLKSNIFFETVGRDFSMFEYFFKDVCEYHNYIPVIVYPVITDFEIQKERIFSRAMSEGRLPDINFVKNSNEQVEKVFEETKYYLLSEKYKGTFYMLKYKNDASLTPEKVERNDFSELEILEEIKIEKK
jgi:hypothetical protein